MKLKDAKALKYGDVVYHRTGRNADGTAQRWRVNGQPKTWKTRPWEVRVPVKRGLYEYGYVDDQNMNEFLLEDPTEGEA